MEQVGHPRRIESTRLPPPPPPPPQQQQQHQQLQHQQEQQQHTYSGSDLTNSATFPFPIHLPPSTNDTAHSAVATTTNTSTSPTPAMYQPADLSDREVDDNAPDDAPVHSTAGPTRGRGRGRGRVHRGKGKIAKPAPAKPVAGRGRRQKVYESARAQAAHERIQELKSAFATVAKAVKPVVQEIADRSIGDLLQDPQLHRKFPEYDAIQTFLRTRFEDAKRTFDLQRKAGTDMVKHVWDAQQEVVYGEYYRRLAEACDERYDQLMAELETLEHLYDFNLPVDLPGITQSIPGILDGEEYLVKAVSQKQFDEQAGPYVEFRDGVEIPFHGRPVSELLTREYQLPDITTPKRKADGQPDGQPNAKMAATAEGGETVPSMARHVSGLLSAVEALEERASTPAESSSNAPTPAAEPADPPSPGNAELAPAGGEPTASDGMEIPLPRYTAGADEHGVRIITRKPTRLDFPNNRIAVPNIFEWDDLDIGFRDSANCVQKGATKAKRGKYLGKAGSNFMFIDRRIGTWDSTQAAGEFDEALIKKHGLHPTLGIVLPTSINDEEPPKPFVSGWKPTILVSPRGEVLHASRTIRGARLDQRARQLYTRIHMRRGVREFCEQEGIGLEDVLPSAEDRDKYRRVQLLARGIDPDAVVTPVLSPEIKDEVEPAPDDDNAVFSHFVDEALDAATALDAEEAARSAEPQRPTTSSRPYDVIRDVFTDVNLPGSSAAQQAPHAAQVLDTQNLSCLADVAEGYQHDLYEQAGYHQPGEFHHPLEGTSQLAYPPQMEQPGQDPSRANDFMRTALILPATDYHPSSEQPVGSAPGVLGQPAGGRMPFSNTGAAKSLPALRPVRSLLSDTPPLPEPQGSPVPQHSSMVVSNSGAYFPPAPSRPFHNGYSLQEPPTMHGLQQPLMHPQHAQAPPIAQGPLQAPPLAPPPPESMSPYSASPPYHGVGVMQQPVTPSQMSPIAAPLQQPQASSAPSPRSRPGSSSAASASGPAAAGVPGPTPAAAAGSSKYRKLEPAPVPSHRMGYGGNGSELRTVQFDYREAIKDYTAVEAPPRHGPTHIRGWTHKNLKTATSTAANVNRKTDEENN